MLKMLDGAVYRAMPSLAWDRWSSVPRVGTIVHILAMGHLCNEDASEFSPLPGGLFAEIIDDEGTTFGEQGLLRMLTLPASVLEHPRYHLWSWECPFPIQLRGPACSNGMRLEVVPPEIQDAVRAFVALHGREPELDQMPITVEDGWLC